MTDSQTAPEAQSSPRSSRLVWLSSVLALLAVLLAGAFVPRTPDSALVEEAMRNKKKFRIRSEYTILIDYTMPITARRLWVMKDSLVVLNTWVAHADKSGFLYATDFSNVFGSNKSSIGSFVTTQTFQWKYNRLEMTLNTPALRLRGLEKQNSEAYNRGIYFHKTYFPMLWSWGCYATLPADNEWITSNCERTFLYVRGR